MPVSTERIAVLRASLKWGLFAIVALVLFWRIVAVNMAQHMAAEDNLAAATWNPHVPDILLTQAAQALATDPTQAQHLALRAGWENPTDGRAFLILGLLWEQQGKLDMAKKAIQIADFLGPRRAGSQLQIAYFWARRGELASALPHWSVALQMQPELSDKLFPELLRYVEMPQYRPAFAKTLNDPPQWWDSFFSYALNNAAHLDTLKAIYLARVNSKSGPRHGERKAYLDLLLRESLWTEAYFVWLNGLDAGQISALGNLFDGGFEQESFEEGYGWRFAHDDAFTVAADPTYGATADRALHVAFQGPKPATTRLVSQYLMLDAGSYQLHGRVRVDSLSAGKGVRWSIACINGAAQEVLASSEHFIGADKWKPFSVDLKIPAKACDAQMLHLDVDPAEADGTDFSGAIWFDDLIMQKLQEQDAPQDTPKPLDRRK